MRSRYRISVGGVHMDTLDDNLMILDISHSPMKRVIAESRAANLNGIDYADTPYLDKTTVTVTFELHIYDIAKRNAACQKVNEWAAAGGTLLSNDRSGQQLRDVVCERFASIASARNWTDPLTVIFATTWNPHWRSGSLKTLALSGKTPKGTLKMDGNLGETPVTVEATAKANVTSFKITVGSTNVELKGLTMKNGSVLKIDHQRGRYLRVRVDDKSVMSLLQPNSSDMLTAKCGENVAVSISANGKVAATISARGEWL